MNIGVIGTGYVGLVTGVALSEIGHTVTCVDISSQKVEQLQKGISPIYEPGLEELLEKNIEEGRLHFTTSHSEGFKGKEVIYIAVGTPENKDGSANLSFIKQAAQDIALNIEQNVIVVTKSTVPVGTNEYINEILQSNLQHSVSVKVVSNPEFLREGSAIYDAFKGDRIVIGCDDSEAGNIIEEINKPFGIPIFKTSIRSAEMIKYASNAFLAAKISFINEISNICEKIGANVEEVADGMGMDKRIGNQFLNAGIGYGGSCFPKDTKALIQIAGNVAHEFTLLKSVIEVNNEQQKLLFKKAKERFGNLAGKRIAVLGLAFKPNTDDMREAPSIQISKLLIQEGATVVAYDPIANYNAEKLLPSQVIYVESKEEALAEADMTFILTEWEEFKNIDIKQFERLMKEPVIFDGRNCFSLESIKDSTIEYHSVGRPVALREKVLS